MRLESEEEIDVEAAMLPDFRGLQVAIWGIVLTAVFGLVSAITGVLQVWASLKTLQQQ